MSVQNGSHCVALMLRCSIITTVKRLIEVVLRRVMPRQAGNEQEITRRSLRPYMTLSFCIEGMATIHSRTVELSRVYIRRVEHDFVCYGVPEGSQKAHPIYKHPRVPVCNVSLVDKLETLIQRLSKSNRNYELKERNNGVTINFWPVSGVSITSSNGTQRLRGS